MKKYIAFILFTCFTMAAFPLSFLNCTGEFAVQPSEVGDILEISIDMGIEPLIEDSIKQNPTNRNVWIVVKTSLESQLIPLLKGDKVNLSNLNDWLNLFYKNNIPACAKTIVAPITTFINLLLKRIPTEKLAEEMKKAKLSDDLRQLFLRVALKFKEAIDSALSSNSKKRAFGEC